MARRRREVVLAVLRAPANKASVRLGRRAADIRDGGTPPGPAGRARLTAAVLAAVVAAGLVGAAAYAAQDTAGQAHRTQEDLELDWQARSSGVQVLGGTRDPGIPSVQRIRHDNVYFLSLIHI